MRRHDRPRGPPRRALRGWCTRAGLHRRKPARGARAPASGPRRRRFRTRRAGRGSCNRAAPRPRTPRDRIALYFFKQNKVAFFTS